MLPEFRHSIHQLLESKEKGRGLALIGWAAVTMFASIAAFASWQFAPMRNAAQVTKLRDADINDVTGTVRQPTRPGMAQVPTVPVPLPNEPGISREQFEALRQDMKELRRVIGRVDASTDVLARRISNLEESTNALIGQSPRGPAKPSASTSMTPPISMAAPAKPSGTEAMADPARTAVPPPLPPTTSLTPAGPASPPVPTSATQAPAVSLSTPQPTVPTTLQSTPVAPPSSGQTTVPMTRPTVTLPPNPAAEKSPLDRSAIERATLERMLLERAPGLDDATRQLPPPSATTVIPKSQPSPTAAMPVGPIVPRPAGPDSVTTGTLPAKPADDAAKPADPARPSAAVVAMREAVQAEKTPEKFGIDLGGYKSIGQVKKAWADVETKAGKVTKGLTPLARLGEATDGVEIRLSAGPFASEDAAQKACAQLKAVSPRCAAGPYAGEPLGQAK